MGLEVSHNTKTGDFSLKFTKHVLNAIGAGLIISGFSSLSSPWWLGLIVGVLEKSNIQIPEDYQWLISGIQILIGLCLVLFKHFFLDKREKQITQDEKTWNEVGLDIDKITHFLNNLVDDHSYVSSEDSEFHNSYSVFLKPKNSLQLKRTQKFYKEYSDSAFALHCFIEENFFVFPRSQTWTNDYRYCLAPHLNDDREGDFSIENSKQYSLLSSDLHKLQKVAKANFDSFVKHLKEVGNL